MEEKNIPADELLRNVFQRLAEIGSNQEVSFSEEASVVIADDSDIHRTRKGFMNYKSVIICRFGSKTWAISIGKAWGDYPADPYKSDIIAIEISPPGLKSEKQISEEIRKLIYLGWYFENSLIIARQNGQITVPENPRNRFKKKILESLRSIAKTFIAQSLVVDDESISARTLEPVVISPVLYKPEFTEVLAKQIAEILSKE